MKASYVANNCDWSPSFQCQSGSDAVGVHVYRNKEVHGRLAIGEKKPKIQ